MLVVTASVATEREESDRVLDAIIVDDGSQGSLRMERG